MTANLGEIVAQLKQVIEDIDKAAVISLRIGEDAATAHAAFETAGTGSDHPRITNATTGAAEARAKADKIARLYTEAANAFADYSNLIAPGSAHARKATPGSRPSGERIVSEAETQGSKADAFILKQVKNLEDSKDKMEQVEKTVTDASKSIQDAWKAKHGPSGTASVGTPSSPATTPEPRPDADNPVTAVVLAAGAIAVGSKALWDKAQKKRQKEQEKDHDD